MAKHRTPVAPRFIRSACYYKLIIHLLLSYSSQTATFIFIKKHPGVFLYIRDAFQCILLFETVTRMRVLYYPYVEHVKGWSFLWFIRTGLERTRQDAAAPPLSICLRLPIVKLPLLHSRMHIILPHFMFRNHASARCPHQMCRAFDAAVHMKGGRFFHQHRPVHAR